MVTFKKNYKVINKLEVFYTGGPARLLRGGEQLVCACGDEVKVRIMMEGRAGWAM